MKAVLRDLRYGLRVLARNPGFATVAVLTLGLGIGFNAAIFSLVDAVLLRPLPYPSPEQLVGLGQWRDQKGEGYVQTGVSAPNIMDIARTGVFQYTAWYRGWGTNITEGNRPETVSGIRASAQLLPMFEVPPLLGRFFGAGETVAGRDQVAVIGYRLWQMRYGSDPAILGKTIALDQRPYKIIGVMPASFRFTWDQAIDVFVPLVLTDVERSEAGRATSRDLQTQARLAPGWNIAKAQAAMDALAVNLAREYPEANKGWGIKVEPLHAAYHRHMEAPLAIMLGAVMFLLLIACANVANLLLARATGRKREIAVRLAVGATSRRLLAQLLTESLVIAACGGLLGLLLAYAGDRVLTLVMVRYQLTLPNARVIALDWRVLLFSIAIVMATGLAFGLAPSWTISKTALGEALRETGLSTTAESGRRKLRNGLVVGEIAIALMLVTAAGLLVRTFIKLVNIDLGIDPSNVVTMGIRLPAYKYSTAIGQAAFYGNLMQKIESIPGVKSAGAEGGGASVFFQPEGQAPAAPGQEPTANYDIVTPDYFRAMGTRLIAGREFNAADHEGTPLVAIVSETVARRYWPTSNPLGRHLTLLARLYSGQSSGVAQPLEIIGVAGDVRGDDLRQPEAAIYVPLAQSPVPSVFLVVRAAVPPLTVVPAVRDAVLSLDDQQPVNRIRTMEDIVSQAYGTIRVPMTLLWIFSALALVLSAVGIFGVMSYTVSRRTPEIAIRMALGAGRRDLLRLVLQEALAVTLIGVAVGLAGSLLVSRVMKGYIYGISSLDPLTLAASPLLIGAVALLASYIPARRAASVDPAIALRFE